MSHGDEVADHAVTGDKSRLDSPPDGPVSSFGHHAVTNAWFIVTGGMPLAARCWLRNASAVAPSTLTGAVAGNAAAAGVGASVVAHMPITATVTRVATAESTRLPAEFGLNALMVWPYLDSLSALTKAANCNHD